MIPEGETIISGPRMVSLFEYNEHRGKIRSLVCRGIVDSGGRVLHLQYLVRLFRRACRQDGSRIQFR